MKKSSVVSNITICGIHFTPLEPLDKHGYLQTRPIDDGWFEHVVWATGEDGNLYLIDEDIGKFIKLPDFVKTILQAEKLLAFAGLWYRKGHEMGEFHKQRSIKNKYFALLEDIGAEHV